MGFVWGSFCHSTGCSLNRKGAGDFHRPYENSEILTLYHSSGGGVVLDEFDGEFVGEAGDDA